MKSLRIAALTVLGLTAACTKKEEAPPTPPPAPKVETKPTPPPPPPEEPKADKECAAPLDATGEATEVKFGDKSAKLTGSKLTMPKDADDLVFGVLGPVNEDSGANIVALRKYLKFFAAEKVDAIIVTGDVGEVAPGIQRVLEELGASKLPVFVTIGNLECRGDYLKGVESAQAKFPNIVNLTQVRAIEFPEQLTLLSLPGHHDAKYIHCATGCQYLPSTVKEIVKAAKESKAPVALIAHGPPHGKGNQALDFATDNVGDEGITAAINDANISFGFFSNIKEAGGRATADAEGTTLVKEGEASKKLFINPGPADATTGWDMNDGTTAMGLAAVFKLHDGAATWKLLRLKQPTAAEKAEAKKLEPPARDAKPE